MTNNEYLLKNNINIQTAQALFQKSSCPDCTSFWAWLQCEHVSPNTKFKPGDIVTTDPKFQMPHTFVVMGLTQDETLYCLCPSNLWIKDLPLQAQKSQFSVIKDAETYLRKIGRVDAGAEGSVSVYPDGLEGKIMRFMHDSLKVPSNRLEYIDQMADTYIRFLAKKTIPSATAVVYTWLSDICMRSKSGNPGEPVEMSDAVWAALNQISCLDDVSLGKFLNISTSFYGGRVICPCAWQSIASSILGA